MTQYVVMYQRTPIQKLLDRALIDNLTLNLTLNTASVDFHDISHFEYFFSRDLCFVNQGTELYKPRTELIIRPEKPFLQNK
ncbi:13875_t:CDS:1, partial [Dentiscutata heterogama]